MPLRLPFVIDERMGMGGWMGQCRIPDWIPGARCGGLGEIGSTVGPAETGNVAQTLQVHPEMVGCPGIHQLHHRSTTQCRGTDYKALNYPGVLGMYTRM